MMELLNEFLSGSVAWGVLLTLAAFALGALVNRVTGKAFFNPLLLGAIFVIIFLSVCGIPYVDYKVSAAPVNYLLLPATVALAIPLYEKLDLLKANAAAIIAGISVGTLVSLGSHLFKGTDISGIPILIISQYQPSLILVITRIFLKRISLSMLQ